MKRLLIVPLVLMTSLVGCKATDEPTPVTMTKTPVPTNTTYTPRHKTTNTVPPKPKVTPKVTPTVKPFASCKEAFEAGSIPIYPSNPRWNPKLDRDKDGMACEH